MKRKNLSVAKKVKYKNLFKRNLKIKKIYKEFRKKMLQNIGKANFAIGVSGGADSLCLAYLSKIYNSEFNNRIHTLIVDHKIRRESTQESHKVKKMLKHKGIESTILTWKGKKPKRNIQLEARKIRYILISNYCLKNNTNYLVTAHHQDDQIENFFIRLFRGSGLTGLSSMAEHSNYSENLKIIRPFLGIGKQDLKSVTKFYFKNYIKDPSNENEKFLRTRIRKYREDLLQEGLDTKKISKTVTNLMIAKNALDFYKKKALNDNVNFLSKNSCIINSKLFSEEAHEVIFKLMSDVLSLVSGSYYPPRSKKILYLINQLKNSKFKKSTLGGCMLEKRDSFISITKETRIKQLSSTR